MPAAAGDKAETTVPCDVAMYDPCSKLTTDATCNGAMGGFCKWTASTCAWNGVNPCAAYDTATYQTKAQTVCEAALVAAWAAPWHRRAA